VVLIAAIEIVRNRVVESFRYNEDDEILEVSFLVSSERAERVGFNVMNGLVTFLRVVFFLLGRIRRRSGARIEKVDIVPSITTKTQAVRTVTPHVKAITQAVRTVTPHVKAITQAVRTVTPRAEAKTKAVRTNHPVVKA
jgi:hypothetical protein